MRHHHEDNQQHQARQAERRDRVDAETSSDMHPPRTVEEQVEELDHSGDDHRRRDPLGAAQSQQEPREPVIGGGPAELENEGAERSGGAVDETRQHFGSDVQSGPSSTGASQND